MNSSQNSDDKKAKGDLVPALSDRKVSISVIIPVYNQEAFIKECLDSLLRQTMREWEAVCIDDGSNDSSPAILDSYAESDKRIRVIHQENQGVSFSRNKAIGLASGEYLFFLDPDDLLPEKDVLETLYTRAKEADVVLRRPAILLRLDPFYLQTGFSFTKRSVFSRVYLL